jgi:hypothetical protein
VPALRTLNIEAHVLGAAQGCCLSGADAPLQHLYQLAVPVTAAEVPLLAALLAQCTPLALLNLQIIWNSRPPTAFVASLAQLAHLPELRIMWAEFVCLAADVFAQLGGLTHELQKSLLKYD